MTEPVVEIRDGENCPFYRSREAQADLLRDLVGEAVEEAILEHGLSPSRILLSTNYYQGRTEPHTSYAEVAVFDRYKVDDTSAVEGVVGTFRDLSEANREEGNVEASSVYEDAANHVERELLPEDDEEEVQRKASVSPTATGDEDDEKE